MNLGVENDTPSGDQATQAASHCSQNKPSGYSSGPSRIIVDVNLNWMVMYNIYVDTYIHAHIYINTVIETMEVQSFHMCVFLDSRSLIQDLM